MRCSGMARTHVCCLSQLPLASCECCMHSMHGMRTVSASVTYSMRAYRHGLVKYPSFSGKKLAHFGIGGAVKR
jgi:hypothetical protein